MAVLGKVGYREIAQIVCFDKFDRKRYLRGKYDVFLCRKTRKQLAPNEVKFRQSEQSFRILSFVIFKNTLEMFTEVARDLGAYRLNIKGSFYPRFSYRKKIEMHAVKFYIWVACPGGGVFQSVGKVYHVARLCRYLPACGSYNGTSADDIAYARLLLSRACVAEMTVRVECVS